MFSHGVPVQLCSRRRSLLYRHTHTETTTCSPVPPRHRLLSTRLAGLAARLATKSSPLTYLPAFLVRSLPGPAERPALHHPVELFPPALRASRFGRFPAGTALFRGILGRQLHRDVPLAGDPAREGGRGVRHATKRVRGAWAGVIAADFEPSVVGVLESQPPVFCIMRLACGSKPRPGAPCFLEQGRKV